MRGVRLTHEAIKRLDRCDVKTRQRVEDTLRYLAANPLEGTLLKGRFQHDRVRSYRVWPYRILYRLVGPDWLEVETIEHRKDVYR